MSVISGQIRIRGWGLGGLSFMGDLFSHGLLIVYVPEEIEREEHSICSWFLSTKEKSG